MKSKIQKLLALLVVLTMLATTVVIPASATTFCECAKDVRTGVVTETVAPTCGDMGYDVYKCNECGGEIIC